MALTEEGAVREAAEGKGAEEAEDKDTAGADGERTVGEGDEDEWEEDEWEEMKVAERKVLSGKDDEPPGAGIEESESLHAAAEADVDEAEQEIKGGEVVEEDAEEEDEAEDEAEEVAEEEEAEEELAEEDAEEEAEEEGDEWEEGEEEGEEEEAEEEEAEEEAPQDEDGEHEAPTDASAAASPSVEARSGRRWMGGTRSASPNGPAAPVAAPVAVPSAPATRSLAAALPPAVAALVDDAPWPTLVVGRSDGRASGRGAAVRNTAAKGEANGAAEGAPPHTSAASRPATSSQRGARAGAEEEVRAGGGYATQRLEADIRELRHDLGQERFKVQQLSGLRDQMAACQRREMQARRDEGTARRELQFSQERVGKQVDFERHEKANLLQQIKSLERLVAEVNDRESGLRAELEEALHYRAGADNLAEEAKKDTTRWRCEAEKQAARATVAEQRCSSFEEKHSEDKAKLYALVKQLRIGGDAPAALAALAGPAASGVAQGKANGKASPPLLKGKQGGVSAGGAATMMRWLCSKRREASVQQKGGKNGSGAIGQRRNGAEAQAEQAAQAVPTSHSRPGARKAPASPPCDTWRDKDDDRVLAREAAARAATLRERLVLLALVAIVASMAGSKLIIGA